MLALCSLCSTLGDSVGPGGPLRVVAMGFKSTKVNLGHYSEMFALSARRFIFYFLFFGPIRQRGCCFEIYISPQITFLTLKMGSVTSCLATVMRLPQKVILYDILRK